MRGLCPIALLAILSASAERIVVTNDDGWAVAQIRAQFHALVDAGHDVILSAPADNQSGTGAMQKTAQPRTEPCEFDSCLPGVAMGNNASDPQLNWINAYPADSAQYGIQTLAPQLWDGALPDVVVSGPNVGHNTGFSVFGSGTIGAAGKAVQLGVPAVAFSGTGTAHESYTALDIVPVSMTVSAAETYASLVSEFLDALFSQPPASPPLLPANIMLNVNFPALDGACTAESVAWVLTRVFPVLLGNPDVATCRNGGRLPVEGTVVSEGCFATVSAIDALLKVDVSKSVQQEVLDRLVGLGFSCV